MRVLLADKLATQVSSSLEQLGCQVRVSPSLKGDSLREAMEEFQPEVVVVRSTKVDADHLQSTTSLALVIRAGAGVNTIDLDRASTLGVFVANCPGKNAVAVAELAMGHLLNADRRIADNVAALRAGDWKKKHFASGCRGIKGRTLGVVGMGNIGQELTLRAQAFGMTVLGYDPFLPSARAAAIGVRLVEDLVELASQSDVLSVHVGLNDQTRGMISAEVLAALKPGSILLNTSRGPVVDEEALIRAVSEGGIKAGLDVFCNEPAADGSWSTEIASLDGVYGTHHIGASTEQASEAVGEEVIRIITAYKSSGEVPNCVNLAITSPATHMLVVRHADKVGVLARVLDQLREAQVNVQEMENIIFRGAIAACARIRMDQAPAAAVIEGIEALPAVHATALVSLENS
jgi:D-3-phosphoglycerate dehydrogenase